VKDREKQLAAKKRYREKNRERLNVQNRAYRKANKEKTKAYYEANRDRFAKLSAAWKKRNPLKRAAQNALNNAIRDGKLMKPSICQRCDVQGRIQAHHPDYTKPLEVEWLCIECHAAEHTA
jgi:hypothetical protein